MEKCFKRGDVGSCHVAVILRRLLGKIKAKHPANAVGGEGDACLFCGLVDAVCQLLGARGEVFVKACALDDFQRFQARCHGNGVARQGACLVNRAQRRNAVHNLFFTTKRCQRHPAADDFAHGGQIGRDAVHRLRAAQRHAKACHHFVVNQHAAVLRGDLAQRVHKFLARFHQIHVARNRLQNHAGDLLAKLLKTGFQAAYIVIRQHDGVLREIGRHARRAGVGKGEQAAARFHQQAVRMPVVAALKFHNLVAPRVATSQADGRHRCLRARRHQAQTLHAGHNFGDFFGDDDFRLRGRAKRQPAQRRLAHRLNHFGVGVSHNRGAP